MLKYVAILGLIASAGVASAETLTSGTISWQGCAAGYPSDIRFDVHHKPGRVEVVHDNEPGSVDLNADGSIGADNMAGKEGRPKTLILNGSIYQGTIRRGDCSGTYSAQ